MWTCVDSICSWCPRCERSEHLVQCLAWTFWTPCNIMFWEAVGLAALSAVCNGSFTAFAKCQRVRSAQVPGYIINFWLCVGIALTSTPIAWATHLRCVGKEGLLSGVLFVLSTTANMHAIQQIGLHQAVGIGCGTAALVSFAYGAIAEPDSVSQLPQALTGIACLLAGMTGIAAAGTRQQAIEAAEHAQPQHQHQSSAAPIAGAANSNPTAAWMQQPLLDEEHYVSGSDPTDVEASSVHPLSAGLHAGKASGPARAHHSTVKGLVLAVLTGLFGGLILAPMDHVGHECRGLPYQASLAAGVLFAAPVGTYCIYWMRERKVTATLPLQPAAAAVPGILAGIVWTAGICSNMVASASIGLAIAYPIMQAGLFVAGLWGILLYHELYSLVPHLLYWGGGVVLAVGTVLVARAGQT